MVRLPFRFAFFKTQFDYKGFSPSFLYVLLLCFSIPRFLSETPECHLLTSEAFNEIILKFLSAESPSILVPVTPSAFFTVTTDSPLTFLFFLTPLIELPGFYKAVK